MARKRNFVILLLAILCSICMVSCPTGGESSNKGTVAVQNGIAKLEAKRLCTYGNRISSKGLVYSDAYAVTVLES